MRKPIEMELRGLKTPRERVWEALLLLDALPSRAAGFDKETINVIEDIYRLIFVRGHNVTKALELVEQEIANSAVKTQIVDFIKASKDGIIKGI